MAVKPQKQAVETSIQPELLTSEAIAFDLEEQIADSLLDSVDWSKVRSAMFKKVQHRFIAWLTSGNHSTLINLSPFPELSALPSRDDEGKAA
ncbi:MAG: hypothetical protein AUK48_14620 [Oscillatoriales cyanobacterium CG2_30_44_21]|nr:MAG: hypothetical protein AUK48_14620 [Oscillatoriales cyanobacterium CG2_30_44_21]